MQILYLPEIQTQQIAVGQDLNPLHHLPPYPPSTFPPLPVPLSNSDLFVLSEDDEPSREVPAVVSLNFTNISR